MCDPHRELRVRQHKRFDLVKGLHGRSDVEVEGRYPAEFTLSMEVVEIATQKDGAALELHIQNLAANSMSAGPKDSHRAVSEHVSITNEKVSHNLDFVPKDIIQTSSIGVGVLTFNFDKFDDTLLDITTTGSITVRAFIGTFEE